MGNFYGYIRVSSTDQNIERQRLDLLRWGIIEKNLFCDMQSGKDFNHLFSPSNAHALPHLDRPRARCR